MSNDKKFIVVLGLDNKRRPRAAKFDASDAVSVTGAADLMGLWTANPKNETQRAMLSKLSQGRLFSSGRALVPLVKRTLYDALIAKFDFDPDTKRGASDQAVHDPIENSLPKPWLDLAIGDNVVAPDPGNPSEDGWWPAKVIAINDDQLTLRWIDAPKLKPAVFSRNAVAILPPPSK